ncbi:MAG: hypothetical protein A2077_06170 [Nitrospirae bacterium GWC2_46_6]|nr:MAG: hypothetical protein A2077_06170 [Nitrospirae bacterium GWC2_46_6]OGW22222.1 MAG: hypothetical protein A2Z82_09835 [Nitrospirae bacterium GWA2_46_11]OGW23246.1 MAG: hypothetical protein A2X55_09770 [Nitrospirae bacterium GWB2_47_37]
MGDENKDLKTDVDKIIEEKERLDKLFKERFTRVITVMFTDLKGSTSIAETQGDFASRTLIKQHNDILFPLIKKHNGVLVKTMGDGTMSYFEKPQNALRAAVEIQKGIDGHNFEKKSNIPILIRIGIHTGQGIVEQNDIFGDVVNVASRFEGQASPGEICISEETFSALDDKSEVYCRFMRETTLKGKSEPVKLYKAFWNPREIEQDMSDKQPIRQKEEKKGLPVAVKILLFIVIPLIVIFLLIRGGNLFNFSEPEEKRTKQHSVTIPGEAK